MGTKFFTVVFMFITNTTFAQQLQVEAMAGVSGYNGDLTQSLISLRTIGPALNLNVKYLMPGNYIVLRGGIAYGKVSGNDKYNSSPSLQSRNLNFKTNIVEGSFCVELNLYNPDDYEGYPYVFAGVGLYHFNPYTFDKNNKKTYLRPLSTEGQGLEAYPDRKMTSTPQLCIPFGGGWKLRYQQNYEIIYEFGVRYLFTDYLDDVSTSYVNPQILLAERGRKAVELAYRQNNSPAVIEGGQRGNPKAKDWYFMTGFKLLIKLGAL